MHVGASANVDELYNVTEFREPLINNNVTKDEHDNNIRLARTAVGQSADGSIVIINGAGGDTSSTARGITETELINIFDEFNVRNASELSNGNKAIIYWNGRVINKTFGYSENGIKLPTALVVKPATLLE